MNDRRYVTCVVLVSSKTYENKQGLLVNDDLSDFFIFKWKSKF